MKRSRRKAEDLISDLESELAALKARVQRQKAQKDPALTQVKAALRAVEAGLKQTRDATTRGGLEEARTILTALLALDGGAPRKERGTLEPRPRPDKEVDPQGVLRFLAARPQSRAEEIARELGVAPAGLRPVLQRLRSEGRVAVEGKARGMRYRLDR